MPKMYYTTMTYRIGFWIKADSEDAAWDWVVSHNIVDVQNKTCKYEDDWDESVSSHAFNYPDDFSFTLDEGEYIDATNEL